MFLISFLICYASNTIMALSQGESKAPDKEAQEDDERQYGHGPLSKEELDLKHVLRCPVEKIVLLLTLQGIPTGLTTTPRRYRFMSFSPSFSTL